MEKSTFPKAKEGKDVSRSKIKVMLIAFFDAKGVVHFQFLSHGETISQLMYKEILQRSLRAVQTRRTKIK